MIVLGIDTATPVTSVGLLTDADLIERRHIPQDGETPGHTREILPLAGELLREAGIAWKDIDRIAVGVGPGTFTGLRIGVATARGLAQALDADIVGVSSLESLARSSGYSPVLACLDARRGEVFVGGLSSDGQRLAERAVRPEDLDPVESRWVAVGDGAVRYRRELEEAGYEVVGALAAPSAGTHCTLGADREPTPRDQLAPNYVREPDAKPQ